MLKLRHIIVILLLWTAAGAMPPRPDRLAQWSPDSRARYESIRARAMENGLDVPGAGLVLHRIQLRRDDMQEVTLRVPVILVDFADNEADRRNHPAARYESLLFSEGEYQTGSVHDFYLECSIGQVSLIGEVVGWYRAPQTYSYYVNRQYGLGNYPRNSQRLAEDAIRAADGDIDYSAFDNDGDGVVDAPFIVHAGGGAEEDPNNPNKIWSHAWQAPNLGALDGVHFNGYTIVPEDGKIGVFTHELGHAMFDLPDLYDTRNVGLGLGYWSTMAYGAWGDEGRRPVHLDAWCKLRLGWLSAPYIRYDQHITLPPVYDAGGAFRLWNPDNRGAEYFLVEYRFHHGFDGELPGEGLLIYHIDENSANNDHPWYPGHQGALHDMVALEQADGNWDLERRENAGDEGDPYPGRSDNHLFNNESTPGSLSYSGEESGVAVRNIQINNDGVEADWEVGQEGPRIIQQTLNLIEGWNLVSLRCTPDDCDVRRMVAPLLEEGSLVFVKDGDGHFYAPAVGFSNIPPWNVRGGYLIKTSRETELTLEGEEVEFDRPIPINDGWQVIAYFPSYQLTPSRAFESLGGRLFMAKDGFGNFYIPRLGFNNMADLESGRGYLVKNIGVGELVYPTR